MLAWFSLVPLALGCTAVLGDFTVPQSAGDGGSGGDTASSGSSGGSSTGSTSGSGTGSSSGSSTSSSSGGSTSGASSGGEAGPPGCTLVTKYKRAITTQPMALNGYDVVHASQTNVMVAARLGGGGGSNPPQSDVVYFFRSDQPSQSVNASPLNGGGPNNDTTSLVAMTRTADNTGTLLLTTDNLTPWLFTWPDSMNQAPSPTPGRNAMTPLGGGLMAASQLGTFYALVESNGASNNVCGDAGPCGTFVDFEGTPNAPPILMNAGLLDMVDDTGLGDSASARAYVMTDGTVSLLYDTPAGLMQAHVAPPPNGVGMVMPSSTRPLDAQMPIVASRNGASSVDLAFANVNQDGGTTNVTLFAGTIPESKLFTFRAQSDLKSVPVFQDLAANVGTGAPPCWASTSGKMVMLLPAGAQPGLNLIAVDITQGTIPLTMLGAANVLSSDTSVDRCALGFSSITNGQYWFDLVWSDNTGNGEVLNYAPLVCTIP